MIRRRLLEYHEHHGFPLTDTLNCEEMVEAVTQESLHQAAQRYLDLDNHILGVLYPEGWGEGQADAGGRAALGVP